MNDHADGRDFAKTHVDPQPPISILDWPTPEKLAAAHRLRGLYLRDLVVTLVRRLRAAVAGHVHVARPAKVPVAHRR